MTMSGGMFGEYQSQSTRALAQISSSRYPDTNKDFEANLRRLNEFVDYIAEYLGVMQKGLDKANQDIVGRIRDVVADFTILLGGGELLYGIDLGDLQYFLPALGAIFGLDADTPFPINLFNMAQRFFLGYVVPLDAFLFTIQDIINGWAVALGLDEEFIQALNDLFGEFIELGTTLQAVLENVWDLLDIFGINTDGFGPFADLWHAVSQLLGGFSLETLGDIVDPVFDALTPWIKTVAQFVSWLNQIIESFSGGLTDLDGILNFAELFTPFTDFLSGAFNPIQAWTDIITNGFLPLNLLLGPNSPLNAFNIFGLLQSWNIPFLPFSHIGAAQPNLLVEFGFDSPDAIAPGGSGWAWDGTVGRTKPGSARATANGAVRELVSIAIPVSEGQELDLGIWTIWSGLSFSGTQHITLGAKAYLFDDHISTTVVDSQTVATATEVTWQELSGNYTVPPGIDSIRLQLRVMSNVTGGSVWFDDASGKKVGLLQQNWIFGLPEALTALFDGIFRGIFGDESGIIDRTADDIAYALRNIPGLNIIGVGAATIVDTVTDIFDFLWSGFARVTGTGKSLTDVMNAANSTATEADTALQVGEWNNAVLGIRNNKSLMEGMDETEESNFLLSEMLDGNANPPIINATSASVPMAFWRATEDSLKGFISWMGRGITNVDDLFIDIYRANYVDNRWDLIHSSVDQIGAATGSWSVIVYNLPEADRFQVIAGDVIGIAWRVVGTGTHEIAGKKSPWLPAHPTIHPQKPAATRTGSGNLAFGSTNYVGDIPWFGIGIVAGDVPPPYFAPRQTTLTTPGTHVYDVPDWCNFVDNVMCGAAGGGQGGSTIAFGFGEGGDQGLWASETLVRGVDFPDVPGAQITFTVGDGGIGGPAGAGPWAGGDGTATVRQAISGGAAALTAAGGGRGNGGSTATGKSPGNHTFNGKEYLGGTGGAAVNGQSGKDGSAPGAGGGGGSGGTWGVAFPGGDGANGRVNLTARQS